MAHFLHFQLNLIGFPHGGHFATSCGMRSRPEAAAGYFYKLISTLLTELGVGQPRCGKRKSSGELQDRLVTVQVDRLFGSMVKEEENHEGAKTLS